jgi:hypothetical protein
MNHLYLLINRLWRLIRPSRSYLPFLVQVYLVNQRLKNIEQEIECPRCNDVMMLTSDFDKLGYVCQECDFRS